MPYFAWLLCSVYPRTINPFACIVLIVVASCDCGTFAYPFMYLSGERHYGSKDTAQCPRPAGKPRKLFGPTSHQFLINLFLTKERFISLKLLV